MGISLSRGFPGDLMTAIKQRPALPLLKLLRRRLMAEHEASLVPGTNIMKRVNSAQRFCDLMSKKDVEIIGGQDPGTHTHWLVPMDARRTSETIRVLCKNGFQATQSSSQLAAISTISKDTQD